MKAGNVIVGGGREAKLPVFGLAKFVGEVNEVLFEQPASVPVAMEVGNGTNGAPVSRRGTERGRDIDPEKTQELRLDSSTVQVTPTTDLTPHGRLIRTPSSPGPEIWRAEPPTFPPDAH